MLSEVKKTRSSGMSRREFHRMLAAAGLTVASLPSLPRKSQASGEVTYMGWAGYDDPGLYTSYQDKYGGMPNFEFWSDAEDGYVKLSSGVVIDVLHPCTDHMLKWQKAGLVAELDESRLTNLPDVIPYLNGIEGMVMDGKRYMMPFDWGLEAIVYRTDMVDAEDFGENLSWRLIFDDEKYKGKVAALNSSATNVQLAGILLGAENIFDMSEAQLDDVGALLAKQRDNLRYYWESPTDVEHSLASGEVVASFAWADMYARLKEQGVPVALAKPKEGVRTWVCGLVIHPDTKDVDAAYDLINSLTSVESGAYILEYFGMGHCNKAAFDKVAPETLAQFYLDDPETFLKSGIFYEPMQPEVEAKYNEVFEAAKAGG